MKLKANDTIHISSVKAEAIRPGETFDVGDAEGKQLVDRGLATKVSAPKAKAAATPNNKKAASPRNKSK